METTVAQSEQIRTLSICIDLETLSLKRNAQIINIGAVAFSHDGSIQIDPNNRCRYIELFVDPASAIGHDFDIDVDTLNWWKKHDKEMNHAMSIGIERRGQSLDAALDALYIFISDIRNVYCDESTRILFWFQGKDFDFPILEHATTEFGYAFPWKHTQLRCARDYVMNGAELLGWYDSPYDHLPKFEVDGVAHTALYDACRSAHNVTEMYNLLKSRFIDKPAPKE